MRFILRELRLASHTICLSSEGRMDGGERLSERKTERLSIWNDEKDQDNVKW
jgi:hypothetical protein